MFQRYMTAIALCLSAFSAQAADKFQDLTITTRGTGRSVVLVHGLNSAASTWDDLCDRYSTQITCHQIQLPGFAGAPPAKTDGYLKAMRDQVIGYIRSRRMESPIIAGHSLGGILAMMIAIEQPALPGSLFIVDSLPYLPAAQNPAATAEVMRPIAELGRRNMIAQEPEKYARQMSFTAQSMARGEGRQKTLQQWTLSSDRETTANAFFDVMTTDLRTDVERIAVPTTVLASWSPNKPMPSPREETSETFERQYARLKDARVVTTQDALHFIMWDDPDLTYREFERLLATAQNKN